MAPCCPSPALERRESSPVELQHHRRALDVVAVDRREDNVGERVEGRGGRERLLGGLTWLGLGFELGLGLGSGLGLELELGLGLGSRLGFFLVVSPMSSTSGLARLASLVAASCASVTE